MKKMTVSGCTVIIDPEDFPVIARFAWTIGKDKHNAYAKTEIFINGERRKIHMHRLIMGMKRRHVDHINKNGLDNRKANLRYCSNAQNCANSRRTNSTGFKGVANYGRASYWARLRKNGKEYKSGPYKTAEEAARSYNQLARKYFGRFAQLNFGETK